MDNWAIILAHNNFYLTRQAIRSLEAQDIPVKIWLVNNGSTDGLVAWACSVSQKFITTHHYPPLPSVSAAWNMALKRLFKEGAEYALVVNNDVELRPDAYRLLLADGSDFVTCVGIREPEWKTAKTATASLARSPHPDFSCYLIRKKVWDIVGPFDENYKIAFFEDNDYHCRMHKADLEARSIDLPYLHHASMTIKNATHLERKTIELQADKNREYFYKKWGFRPATPEYDKFFGG